MPDPNLALGSSAPPYPVFIVRKPASAKPSMAALVGPPEGTVDVQLHPELGLDYTQHGMSFPYF